jgi:hypothetical protein
VEIAKNICEVLAILVGGAWTYLNYFRGRTYRPRLELGLSASIEKRGLHSFLGISAQVKNVGLSKVKIDQSGTGVLVYAAVPNADVDVSYPRELEWDEKYSIFEVFTSHQWIEPNEPVGQMLLVILPEPPALAYKIELKVLSGKIWWTAVTTIQSKPSPDEGGSSHGQTHIRQ